MKEEYTVQQDGVGAVTDATVTCDCAVVLELSPWLLLRHSAFSAFVHQKEKKETKWHFWRGSRSNEYFLSAYDTAVSGTLKSTLRLVFIKIID